MKENSSNNFNKESYPENTILRSENDNSKNNKIKKPPGSCDHNEIEKSKTNNKDKIDITTSKESELENNNMHLFDNLNSNHNNLNLVILPLEKNYSSKTNFFSSQEEIQKSEKLDKQISDKKENFINTDSFKNKNYIQRRANKISQQSVLNCNNISNEMNFKRINLNTDSCISVNNSSSLISISNNNITNSEDRDKILDENNLSNFERNLLYDTNNYNASRNPNFFLSNSNIFCNQIENMNFDGK